MKLETILTGAVKKTTTHSKRQWVALIDRTESRHREFVEWLRRFKGEIFRTEAVLTEVLYLLNFSSPPTLIPNKPNADS